MKIYNVSGAILKEVIIKLSERTVYFNEDRWRSVAFPQEMAMEFRYQDGMCEEYVAFITETLPRVSFDEIEATLDRTCEDGSYFFWCGGYKFRLASICFKTEIPMEYGFPRSKDDAKSA